MAWCPGPLAVGGAFAQAAMGESGRCYATQQTANDAIVACGQSTSWQFGQSHSAFVKQPLFGQSPLKPE
jgi:hypothetical protein